MSSLNGSGKWKQDFLCMCALIGAVTAFAALPADAHHGKDFLITGTDDMPIPGSIYALMSVDDAIDTDRSARSAEVSTGLLFALSNTTSLEPHLHYERLEGGGYGYGATAVELRHAFGFLPGSEWRVAASLEMERPKADATNLQGRLIFARTLPNALVAVNFVGGRAFQGNPGQYWSLITSALRPLGPVDNIGLEVMTLLPTRAVEILPGIYHLFGGPTGATSLKFGVGYFTSSGTRGGTVHLSVVRRFG